LAKGRAEVWWRAAVIHAYYALVLECRDALARLGFTVPRLNMHADVRMRLTNAGDLDLRQIGADLDKLGRRRNHANYDLRRSVEFTTDAEATRKVKLASDGLALLDAIDADPARRAAAVASIRP
jgi:hypothetical protein